MKKYIILFFSLLILGNTVFSQVANLTFGKEDSSNQFIFYLEGNPYQYMKADGTIIPKDEAIGLLSLCPANKGIIEQVKTGDIITWFGIGASSILSITALSLTLTDSIDKKTTLTLLSSSIFDFILTMFVANDTTNFRIKALSNYNQFIRS
jgi:hypothetical protein